MRAVLSRCVSLRCARLLVFLRVALDSFVRLVDSVGMEANTSARHEVLCRIAEACGLTYRQSICIPATVGVFAKSVGWTEHRMAEEVAQNAPLREYFAELVRKCAEGPIPGFDAE